MTGQSWGEGKPPAGQAAWGQAAAPAPRKQPGKKATKKAPGKKTAAKAAPAEPATPHQVTPPSGPAGALFAAAAREAQRHDLAAQRQRHRMKPPDPEPPDQVPASPPVRMEVRINGKVRFSDTVYSPHFDNTNGLLTVTAALQPTMVDAPHLRPPTRFIDQNDPRDQEDVIHQVHSGRRDTPQEQP